MRVRVVLSLMLLLATFELGAQLTVQVDEAVLPGGVITVEVLAGTTVEELSVDLRDGESRLSANRGVALPVEGGGERWVALVGVSSTIRPGRYEIVVSADPGGEARRVVTVLPRDFRVSEIRLNESISSLRREEDPRKREEALEMLAVTNGFDSASRFWAGLFRLPLDTIRRTSRYGDRRRFVYADGGEARSIHRGLDFAAPQGTPVYAPGAGRVVFASSRIVTGNSVVIEHFPGVYGLFYHLEPISVSPGDLLEQGAQIGTVGTTGVSTGPHLHWELRVGGVSVDPEAFLDAPLVDTTGEPGALSDQTEGG